MTVRHLPHLFVQRRALSEAYRPYGLSIPPKKVPPPSDRQAHSTRLKKELLSAQAQARQQQEKIPLQLEKPPLGFYLTFDSQPDFDLKLESLASKRQKIELVAVKTVDNGNPKDSSLIQEATVFIPYLAVKYFLTQFEKYANDKTKKGEPRYKEAIDRISRLRLATLKNLWTDAEEMYPKPGEAIWWEVWLRKEEGHELVRWQEFVEKSQLPTAERTLEFHERTVILAHATAEQLSVSIDVLGDLAEVRKAKLSAGVFLEMPAEEQAEWIQDLLNRTTFTYNPESPAVCILDTGVNRGHLLLSPALASEDVHSYNPTWGVDDHHGHGTEMAGLALFGDLNPALQSSAPIHLAHRLESVKILPPAGENLPELYGAITADATARVKITNPERHRCFSMAVTAPDLRDQGQPSSWSSAVDALAFGNMLLRGKQALDPSSKPTHLLFVLCAGNIPLDRIGHNHLQVSDLWSIHDPGQAWNGLTVGAYTNLGILDKDDAEQYEGWSPVAHVGELSPLSTTSSSFVEAWPLKPDIVFEGGNVLLSPDQKDAVVPPSFCVVTTSRKLGDSALISSNATSAATAQVARMAAVLWAEYPQMWPETVRGLLVHSAEWTQRMKSHFQTNSGKNDRVGLLRRYGYGVPDLDRALRSAKNAVTLILQDTLHPFQQGKMNEIHFHDLPWPKEVLEALDTATVRLRITLSYFIDPNPSRLGWKTKHRYASHGLRFAVKQPTETPDEFHRRLNQLALEEEESKPTRSREAIPWFLGKQAQTKGSLHADFWEGTAAQLASCGKIAVYPITGWWKGQPKWDQSDAGVRYALIVSLETKETKVDLWTPIDQQIKVPIPTMIG